MIAWDSRLTSHWKQDPKVFSLRQRSSLVEEGARGLGGGE